MMIRGFELRDVEQLKEIHEKYYKEEFELPNFLDKFICAFSVVSNDELIVVGGVRTITESVIVTKKDLPSKKKVMALLEVLEASRYIAGGAGYDQLHAFIQDAKWQSQLTRYGFKPCKGQALYVDI